MTAITQINTLTPPSVEPTNVSHKKLSRLGQLNLLVALNMLHTATDSLQASITTATQNFALNGVKNLAATNQAQLEADTTNMNTFSETHQKDRNSNGQYIFGAEMMALENGYAADKATCQKTMTSATTLVTQMTDSEATISKSTGFISTEEQTTLNLSSNVLDLVLSFIA